MRKRAREWRPPTRLIGEPPKPWSNLSGCWCPGPYSPSPLASSSGGSPACFAASQGPTAPALNGFANSWSDDGSRINGLPERYHRLGQHSAPPWQALKYLASAPAARLKSTTGNRSPGIDLQQSIPGHPSRGAQRSIDLHSDWPMMVFLAINDLIASNYDDRRSILASINQSQPSPSQGLFLHSNNERVINPNRFRALSHHQPQSGPNA